MFYHNKQKRRKELGLLPDAYISAEYKGGHPLITKEKKCDLRIKNDDITISCGGQSATIGYDAITGIHYETEEQINRRLTATRMVALGVFALAFKKKGKDVSKYLTIDFVEADIECTVVISGKQSNEAYSKLFERYSNYKKRNKGDN